MVVVEITTLTAIQVLVAVPFRLYSPPQITDMRILPACLLPVENQQPTEHQSAQVGKMSHMIGCQTRHRTQTGEQLDERLDNNEHARTYRHRDKEQEHRYIRIEPSEGEQDAEYGT